MLAASSLTAKWITLTRGRLWRSLLTPVSRKALVFQISMLHRLTGLLLTVICCDVAQAIISLFTFHHGNDSFCTIKSINNPHNFERKTKCRMIMKHFFFPPQRGFFRLQIKLSVIHIWTKSALKTIAKLRRFCSQHMLHLDHRNVLGLFQVTTRLILLCYLLDWSWKCWKEKVESVESENFNFLLNENIKNYS